MKSKTLSFLGLFIFFAALVALFTATFLSNFQSNAKGQVNKLISSTASSSPLTLSVAEVAKHNSAQDCWMIIGNKVYDFTALINTHSGGSQTILKDCGKDGTLSFQTKDRQPGVNHSASASNILQSYYLGDLGQTLMLSIKAQSN